MMISYARHHKGGEAVLIDPGSDSPVKPFAIRVPGLKGTWHHVAVVFRGEGCDVYIDGIKSESIEGP